MHACMCVCVCIVVFWVPMADVIDKVINSRNTLSVWQLSVVLDGHSIHISYLVPTVTAYNITQIHTYIALCCRARLIVGLP